MENNNPKQELTVEMVEEIIDFQKRKASDLKKIAPWVAADGLRPTKEQMRKLSEKLFKEKK